MLFPVTIIAQTGNIVKQNGYNTEREITNTEAQIKSASTMPKNSLLVLKRKTAEHSPIKRTTKEGYCRDCAVIVGGVIIDAAKEVNAGRVCGNLVFSVRKAHASADMLHRPQYMKKLRHAAHFFGNHCCMDAAEAFMTVRRVLRSRGAK